MPHHHHRVLLLAGLIVAYFFPCPCVTAQKSATSRPSLETVRTPVPPRIDGVLDEKEWELAPPAGDFTVTRPNPGAPASQPIDVRFLYDDLGIYVGARLYDSQPDSILGELTERDDIGNTDFFGFTLDPYRSGRSGFTFIVSTQNVQFDARFEENQGEDESWDAVWQSATRQDREGWVAEFFIPFSALRFPKSAEQIWSLNIVRMLQRKNEQSFWSPVDPNVDGYLTQAGTLTGLYDIKAPVRIQATPFVTGIAARGHAPGERADNAYRLTGGMDVKVGLSDAFTLDMTLIPDFSEARSDDQVLNLGPFEQQFAEQRPFFTEGVELFNKGNLFYSRRVGANASLLNATKISGRTAGGTGIGFFNAIEQRAKEDEQLVNPLTNYNVFVVDQNLPNNSSVTLVNTNVTREGGAQDANVTGLLLNLRNKANSYALDGGYKQSFTGSDLSVSGHAFNLEVGRISGKFNVSLEYSEESDTYDPNDLGLLFANNERSLELFGRYFEPNPIFGGTLLNGGVGLFQRYQRLYRPDRYVGYNLELFVWGTTRGFWNLNFWTDHQLGEQHDYFEPRTDGYYWRAPGYSNFGGWVGTDNRKRWRASVNWNLNRWRSEEARSRISVSTSLRYRFSDRLSLTASLWRANDYGDLGFVNREMIDDLPNVYFGRRDRRNLEAGLSGKYSFSATMNLSLRMRHYWSGVRYAGYHHLREDGLLHETDYLGKHDQDVDFFNLDLIYRWRFAPGSDLFIVYKSAVTDFDQEQARTYGESLRGLWMNTDRRGSLSVKAVYWLDYASLRGRRGGGVGAGIRGGG